jgi:hypothetical protein
LKQSSSCFVLITESRKNQDAGEIVFRSQDNPANAERDQIQHKFRRVLRRRVTLIPRRPHQPQYHSPRPQRLVDQPSRGADRGLLGGGAAAPDGVRVEIDGPIPSGRGADHNAVSVAIFHLQRGWDLSQWHRFSSSKLTLALWPSDACQAAQAGPQTAALVWAGLACQRVLRWIWYLSDGGGQIIDVAAVHSVYDPAIEARFGFFPAADAIACIILHLIVPFVGRTVQVY